MERISIIGSRTLLGKHLLSAFDESMPDVKKSVWNYDVDNLDGLNVALTNCDVVFNLHELQDFTVIPNSAKLDEHNVKFVEQLLARCKAMNCRNIVHLSSVYLQTSSKWPNVHGSEGEFAVFRNECPFPEYCQSKFLAEQAIRCSDLKSIIAHVGPLYGEDDRHSLVCDSILITKFLGFVPLIGDQGGVLQFTYAGNAAYALLKCAEKFFERDNVDLVDSFHTESVIISDKTPLKDIYTLLLEPIMNGETDDEDETTKEEEGPQPSSDPSNIRIGHTRIPFYLFYLPYALLSMFIWLFGQVFGVNSILFKIPSTQYFYLLLRHWTFFSDFKLRIFFDYVPKFTWEVSLRRSRAYYRQLKPEQIDGFSWMPAN